MIVEQLFWSWHWARHMIKQKLSPIKSQGLHCNILLSSYKVGVGDENSEIRSLAPAPTGSRSSAII